MKICTKCDIEKEISAFGKHPQCADGFNTQCKECVASRSRSWYADKGSDLNNTRRKVYRTPAGKARSIYRSMQLACKKNGWANPEYSVDEICQIISEGRCQVTGIPFELENRHASKRNPFAPSPDRIDNDQGYTKVNVQWVVWIYNQMKSDYSPLLVDNFIEGLKNARCTN